MGVCCYGIVLGIGARRRRACREPQEQGKRNGVGAVAGGVVYPLALPAAGRRGWVYRSCIVGGGKLGSFLGGSTAEAAEPWDGSIAASLSGNGTDTDPYIIATAADLALMAYNVNNYNANYGNKYYKLTADIDLGNNPWTPIGLGTSAANRFAGTFDGGGYTISNMLVSGDYRYAGLFGYASGMEVAIKDTHLTDFTVDITVVGSNTNAGGLVGGNYQGKITNCSASGSVTITVSGAGGSAYVGGLVGADSAGKISNCSASVVVAAVSDTSLANAGGLVGFASGAEIFNCSASGSAEADSDASIANAGGLVGCTMSGTQISNCSASGGAAAVSIGETARAGGLVGDDNSETIFNCSASGRAAADSKESHAYAGGLVGFAFGAKISNCSASGGATADSRDSDAYAAGLIGRATVSGTITNCFSSGGVIATGNTSNYQGGLVGSNSAEVKDCRWLDDGSGLQTVGWGGSTVDNNTISVDIDSLKALATPPSWDIAAGWRLTSLDNDSGMHRTLFFTDDVANLISPDAVFTAPGSLALSGGEIKMLHLIPAYFHAEKNSMEFDCDLDGVSFAQHSSSPDVVIISAGAGIKTASGEVTIEYEISGDIISNTKQEKTFTLRTISTLEITTANLPEGRVYTPYSQTIETSGAKGTVTITVSEDKLPAGVSFDGTDTISGTPTVDGTFPFNVIAVDSAGQVAEKTLTLTILDADALFIFDAAFDGDEIWLGESFSATVSADGGVKPYTFSAPNADKPLPPGLSINTSGDISGTPTTEGDYTFNILVTDYASKTNSRDFTLTVTDPTVLVDIGGRFPAPSSSSAAVITPITVGTPASVGTAITQVMPVSASILPLAASAADVSGHVSLTDGLKIDIDLDAADGKTLFLNYEARLSLLAASLPELANWPNIDDDARAELLESLAESKGLALIYEYVTPESASVPYMAIIGSYGLLGWTEAIETGVIAANSTGISLKYAVIDGPGKPRLDTGGSKFVVIPDGKTDNRLRDPLWLAIETASDDPHRSGSGAGCATGAGMIALIGLGVMLTRRREL